MKLAFSLPHEGFSDKELTSRMSIYQNLKQREGNTFSTAAMLTNVPIEVLYAFAMIESNGNPKAGGSSRYQGYMQIDTGTATVELFYANKQGRMSPALYQTLVSILGEPALRCLATMKNETLPSCQVVTRAKLWQPLLNLICGGLYLRRLMNRYSENGVVRYDKVVVAYNRGAHIETKFPMRGLTPLAVYAQAPIKIKGQLGVITQGYIAKLIGTNGILPALTA